MYAKTAGPLLSVASTFTPPSSVSTQPFFLKDWSCLIQPTESGVPFV